MELTAGELYFDGQGRESFLAALRASGELRGNECRLRKQDGSEASNMENTALIADDSGGAAIIEGTIIDVTKTAGTSKSSVCSRSVRPFSTRSSTFQCRSRCSTRVEDVSYLGCNRAVRRVLRGTR